MMDDDKKMMLIEETLTIDSSMIRPHRIDVKGRRPTHSDVDGYLKVFIDDVGEIIADGYDNRQFINAAATFIFDVWTDWFGINSLYYSPLQQFDRDFEVGNDAIAKNPDSYYGRQKEMIALALEYNGDPSTQQLFDAVRNGFDYMSNNVK